MKTVMTFRRMCILALTVLMLVHISLYSAANPARVDFYDKSDNHLMYMVFNYNEGGGFVGRTVYMADDMFKRNVIVSTDASGNRVETSYDFNNDVSFVTKMQSDAAKTSFTIRDQFDLDHVGGSVSYLKADPLNYNLVYADNAFASRISYVNDAKGDLDWVHIFDEAGTLQYKGKFSYAVDVKNSSSHAAMGAQATIKMVGRSGIDLRLNLKTKSNIKCELVTLNGRIAGVLFDKEVPKGEFHHQINTIQRKSVSTGVYLFMVSVNGKVIASSKYLSEAAMGGVR